MVEYIASLNIQEGYYSYGIKLSWLLFAPSHPDGLCHCNKIHSYVSVRIIDADKIRLNMTMNKIVMFETHHMGKCSCMADSICNECVRQESLTYLWLLYTSRSYLGQYGVLIKTLSWKSETSVHTKKNKWNIASTIASPEHNCLIKNSFDLAQMKIIWGWFCPRKICLKLWKRPFTNGRGFGYACNVQMRTWHRIMCMLCASRLLSRSLCALAIGPNPFGPLTITLKLHWGKITRVGSYIMLMALHRPG